MNGVVEHKTYRCLHSTIFHKPVIVKARRLSDAGYPEIFASIARIVFRIPKIFRIPKNSSDIRVPRIVPVQAAAVRAPSCRPPGATKNRHACRFVLLPDFHRRCVFPLFPICPNSAGSFREGWRLRRLLGRGAYGLSL